MKVLLILLKWIAISIVLSYLCIGLFALIFAKKMIFPQPPSTYTESPDIKKIPYGDNGDFVASLFLPNPSAEFLILYSGGNAEDLGTALPRLQALRSQGYAVVAWDYPGYGISSGSPSEEAVFQASKEVLRYVYEDLNVPLHRVVLYGRSLGGGPSVWLASHIPIGGLIVEGTFTSTFRVMTGIKLLPWDVFDNLPRIKKIQCPVLILHGTDDETVNFLHGEALLEAAPEPKSFVWFDRGGHNNLVEDYGDIYYPALESFFSQLPKEPRELPQEKP